MTKVVDIFFVGAMKAGTTSMFHALSRSDKFFLPSIKEPNHFCTDLHRHPHYFMIPTLNNFRGIQWVRSSRKYDELYQCAEDGKLLVDASTTYMYSREAALNIFQHNASARIVILIRSPIERAFSEFVMNRAIGHESARTFAEAIAREVEAEKAGQPFLLKHYVSASRYTEQVERYLNIFPRKNVYIDVMDNPKENFSDVMSRIFAWVGVDPPNQLGAIRENVSRVPKLSLINTALYYAGIKALVSRGFPIELKARAKAEYYSNEPVILSADERRSLNPHFSAETEKLELLTGLSLSHWLRC